MEPAPIREKRTSWTTFIKAHLGAIAAADFFTVEVASLAGLIRYHVFFFIDIASRKVEIAGITSRPEGRWMDQIARNLLDVEDGFLLGKRYLLLDRDPLYTKAFRTALEKGGTTVVRLPPRSPDLNAFAERFVLSHQERVPRSDRAVRRAPSSASGLGSCRSLPPRAESPRAQEPADRDRARAREHQRSDCSPRAARRSRQLL
jgi:hypothetical protein